MRRRGGGVIHVALFGVVVVVGPRALQLFFYGVLSAAYSLVISAGVIARRTQLAGYMDVCGAPSTNPCIKGVDRSIDRPLLAESEHADFGFSLGLALHSGAPPVLSLSMRVRCRRSCLCCFLMKDARSIHCFLPSCFSNQSNTSRETQKARRPHRENNSEWGGKGARRTAAGQQAGGPPFLGGGGGLGLVARLWAARRPLAGSCRSDATTGNNSAVHARAPPLQFWGKRRD